MDSQRGPLLSLAYFCQGKTMEELRYSLLYTTLELEQTRMAAQEEMEKRDDQLIQLKELLSKATRERDEAQEKCRKLFLEKLLLHQQQQQQHVAPLSGVSGVEDERKRGIDSNNGFSSSDCEGSIVSSPVLDPVQQPQLPPAPPSQSIELVPDKPLPEKGKLLQAVMKAGPLLQTLLLAGPLPQWRHPPPPLESFEIPPVTLPSPPPPPQLLQDSLTSINAYNTLNTCGQINRKRGLYDASDSPTETKCRQLVLN
ncbi:shugoshin-1-like [Hibiscus syriacus]|uniref:Shugoshin-1-like n=1 Tax=Hibiscus syriacus TaxID=106335 RepID=A0A6A3B3A6_HIBSY|nr:protein enabled homolog [Hibiscus syriacus]KAE8711226.1 shugoshin-1-like [Hibiscus syriacus]